MKVFVLIFATLLMGACASIKPNNPPMLSPFGDGSQWVLREDMKFEMVLNEGTRASITVPKGFVTDLASTPRRVWALYPPFGKYLSASIVHDYLYWTQSSGQNILPSHETISGGHGHSSHIPDDFKITGSARLATKSTGKK